MSWSPLAAACAVATLATTCAGLPPRPPASPADPAGIVMGTKHDHILMIGRLNRADAYERFATPAQIAACTRRPDMRYPHCLPPAS